MLNTEEHKFIFGCGAQGRVVRDILHAQYPNAVFYFVDENEILINTTINNTKVISVEEMLKVTEKPKIHIALGNPNTRQKVYNKLKDLGCDFLSAIHPSAVVMPTATIKEGCMIAAGTIINTDAKIGKCCIVNTGAIIEHDTEMADFSCVSPGSTIGGRVMIGEKAFVASSAVVLARTIIGKNAIVGMGAVVMKDVENNNIVYGSPATVKGKVDDLFNWNRLF